MNRAVDLHQATETIHLFKYKVLIFYLIKAAIFVFVSLCVLCVFIGVSGSDLDDLFEKVII